MCIRDSTYCDPSTEKTNAGALSETAAGILFIANLPHRERSLTSKNEFNEQSYVHTQLAIDTASIMNLNNNKSRSRSKPRSSAKYCAKERIKRLTSKYEPKRIINKNESKQEIQVIQSVLISRKIIKRGRSTPNGVISRLYTSSNIIQLVTY